MLSDRLDQLSWLVMLCVCWHCTVLAVGLVRLAVEILLGYQARLAPDQARLAPDQARLLLSIRPPLKLVL